MNEHEEEFLESTREDLEEEYVRKKEIKSTVIFTVFCIILLSIVAVIFLFCYKDLSKEKTLYTSLNNMDKKVGNNLSVNMQIYSEGDYGKVEKIVKESYSSFIESYNKINTLYKELDTAKILNIETYKKDGPEFTATKAKLEENKKTREEEIQKIKNLYSKPYIDSKVREYNLDEYFSKLYFKVLNELNLKAHVNAIEKHETSINNHTEKVVAVLDFLTKNKGNWEISENEIVSYDPNFILTFNEMISNVNKK